MVLGLRFRVLSAVRVAAVGEYGRFVVGRGGRWWVALGLPAAVAVRVRVRILL